MNFSDPKRPLSELSATKSSLQVNGSPLPVITLMHPMQNGGETDNVEENVAWGWLACIHAHRGSNRFGTYYGWIRDLGDFQREYLDDPEGALLEYFKYSGPEIEQTAHGAKGTSTIEEDIFS